VWEPGLEVILPPDNDLALFLTTSLGPPVYSDDELDVFELDTGV